MTKDQKQKLIKAFTRIDWLALESPAFLKNDDGEAEQYQKDYRLIKKFLNDLPEEKDKIGSRKKDFTSGGRQGNWMKVHKLDK